MAKRMYLVALKRKKCLVEATSQEAAIRAATKPLVVSCTIPTALEAAKMMTDPDVEVISETIDAAKPKPKDDGVGPLSSEQPPEEDRQGETSE